METALLAAIANLSFEWTTLTDLEKADRIVAVLAAGIKRRALARALHCSEGLVRHLAIAGTADPKDKAQAMQGLISTRELVRRVRSRRARQSKVHPATSHVDLEAGARDRAAEIISWLGQHLAPAFAEQALEEARSMLIRAEQNGSLPKGRAPEGMATGDIIRRCRPTDLMNPDLSFVEGYSRWLALWAFYSMPDSRTRERAFQVAWTTVIRR